MKSSTITVERNVRTMFNESVEVASSEAIREAIDSKYGGKITTAHEYGNNLNRTIERLNWTLHLDGKLTASMSGGWKRKDVNGETVVYEILDHFHKSTMGLTYCDERKTSVCGYLRFERNGILFIETVPEFRQEKVKKALSGEGNPVQFWGTSTSLKHDKRD